MSKINIPTLSLPGAVVIAGVLIALAIAFTSHPPVSAIEPTPTEDTAENLSAVSPVSQRDHVQGNPNAPITIVEYSDLDCPFCERFHSTLEQIVAEYPNDVRWVYRHFPLSSHPHADDEAVIAECVNKIGGSEAFWSILPKLFQIPSSQSAEFNTDPIYAETNKLGIDTVALQSCYDSGEFESVIDEHLENAAQTGGNGTPWSIIIGPNGEYKSVNGAQPYAVIKSIVDDTLNQ